MKSATQKNIFHEGFICTMIRKNLCLSFCNKGTFFKNLNNFRTKTKRLGEICHKNFYSKKLYCLDVIFYFYNILDLCPLCSNTSAENRCTSKINATIDTFLNTSKHCNVIHEIFGYLISKIVLKLHNKEDKSYEKKIY